MHLKNIVVSSPFLVPLFLAVFTAVTLLFLVLDFYKPAFIWPVGIIAGLFLSYLAYVKIIQYIPATKERLIYSILAIAVSAVWFLGNAQFTSQHVYVDRDPGIYSTAAIWLTHNDSLRIEQDNEVFGNENVESAGSGYKQSLHNENELFTQGAHAFPALLGLVGRVGGEELLLHINPLIGAVALLAVFGFASLMFTKKKWALLATLILSVSLPLIYFSRDTYSEPLALVFVFAALSFLYFAQKSNRLSIWLTAGIVAGAGALTRIDALLAIIGMLVAAFLVVFLASTQERKASISGVVVYIAAILALIGLGLFDLIYLSSGYFYDHSRQIFAQLALAGTVVFVGLLVIALQRRIGPKLTTLYVAHKSKIVTTVGYLSGAVLLLLMTRPLWFRGKEVRDIAHVRGIQESSGIPVDGFRNYAENSMEWMMWYVGAATLLLALVGVVLIAIKAVKSKNILWFAFSAVVAGAAIVYLNVPSITADQIWASRRFLPVIIPGLILAAVYVLSVIDDNRKVLPAKIRPHISAVLYGVGALCLVGALITTMPFANKRTFDGQLAQVQGVCSELPENAALLLTGNYSYVSVQSFRAICRDVTVGHVQADISISNKMIADINASVIDNGKVLYIGALETNTEILKSNGVEAPFSQLSFDRYEYTLTKKPENMVTSVVNLYLAEVGSDGVIREVSDGKTD